MANIYYSVSTLIGDVKHDSIWADSNIFEVVGGGDSLVDTSREYKNYDELFFFLGETYHTLEDMEGIVDTYPARYQDYHFLSNNCWHFARWFMGQLGFVGWSLPNPNRNLAGTGRFLFFWIKYYEGEWLPYRIGIDDEHDR